jgi:arylformamidase
MSNVGPGGAERFDLRWRSLSAEEREREYSPSSCVDGDIEPFLTEYSKRSEASRRWCEEAGLTIQTVEYGHLSSQTIDVVVPTVSNSPIVVFIHGGYWQELSKRESFGPAADFVSRGVAFAAVDYTLAPAATFDQIVTECRSAVALIHAQAARLNVDPNRIIIAGSSAGAHLAAMVALDPTIGWRPAGLVLLSGIYELEPLIGTTINDALSLDVASALRNSPVSLPISNPVPSVIAWGSNETGQFKQQSLLFAQQLEDAGTPPTQVQAAGRNHFDILSDLGRIQSELGGAVAALIESTRETNAQL